MIGGYRERRCLLRNRRRKLRRVVLRVRRGRRDESRPARRQRAIDHKRRQPIGIRRHHGSAEIVLARSIVGIGRKDLDRERRFGVLLSVPVTAVLDAPYCTVPSTGAAWFKLAPGARSIPSVPLS